MSALSRLVPTGGKLSLPTIGGVPPTPALVAVSAHVTLPLVVLGAASDVDGCARVHGQGANLSGSGRPTTPGGRSSGDPPHQRPAPAPRARHTARWPAHRGTRRSRRGRTGPSSRPSTQWVPPGASTTRGAAPAAPPPATSPRRRSARRGAPRHDRVRPARGRAPA